MMHMHIKAKNGFHWQSIAVNYKRWLFWICFWGLSDIHESLSVHWLPLVGLYRQPLGWKSTADLMILAMDNIVFSDILSEIVGHFTLSCPVTSHFVSWTGHEIDWSHWSTGFKYKLDSSCTWIIYCYVYVHYIERMYMCMCTSQNYRKLKCWFCFVFCVASWLPHYPYLIFLISVCSVVKNHPKWYKI